MVVILITKLYTIAKNVATFDLKYEVFSFNIQVGQKERGKKIHICNLIQEEPGKNPLAESFCEG